MKQSQPPFGLISGISTSAGLFPHIVSLCLIAFFNQNQPLVMPLLIFTIAAKGFGEWLFWGKLFPERMANERSLRNWHDSVNRSLFAKPNVIVSILSVLLDSCVDIFLLTLALKTATSPVWIILGYVVCQALGAPIHGIISDLYSRKKCLVFSMLVAGLTLAVSREVGREVGREMSLYSYITILGLDHFSEATQMLLVLFSKGLFSNIPVVSRAVIAKCIQEGATRQAT